MILDGRWEFLQFCIRLFQVGEDFADYPWEADRE